MEKRNREPGAARTVAARRRAELGVIATYILDLAERREQGSPRRGAIRAVTA